MLLILFSLNIVISALNLLFLGDTNRMIAEVSVYSKYKLLLKGLLKDLGIQTNWYAYNIQDDINYFEFPLLFKF